jgi:hypothetical protein
MKRIPPSLTTSKKETEQAPIQDSSDNERFHHSTMPFSIGKILLIPAI